MTSPVSNPIALLDAVELPGKPRVEVTYELYQHFLNLLPPITMTGNTFEFAEGYMETIRFTADEFAGVRSYYAKLSGRINPHA
jgi:hypothetical protein